MTDTPTKCAACGGVWHPATGAMVGQPTEVAICGRCLNEEIIPLIKDTMPREIKISAARKREWTSTPKAERGPRPWVSFYEHAATSIGASRRES
jgi:hypothetical protein